mmetsp:Transcript_51019/g.119333  ORF Transcript_51019/g.119333 Transcript_51019/m.119333 type:complete len:216 (-) Transcript_51019:60-707(-)
MSEVSEDPILLLTNLSHVRAYPAAKFGPPPRTSERWRYPLATAPDGPLTITDPHRDINGRYARESEVSFTRAGRRRSLSRSSSLSDDAGPGPGHYIKPDFSSKPWRSPPKCTFGTGRRVEGVLGLTHPIPPDDASPGPAYNPGRVSTLVGVPTPKITPRIAPPAVVKTRGDGTLAIQGDSRRRPGNASQLGRWKSQGQAANGGRMMAASTQFGCY